MTVWSYIARNADGERIAGRLAGASEQAVLGELQARNLSPVRVEEVRERRSFRRRVSSRHLATAYRQASDLLRAGVPLLRALHLLGRGKSNPVLAGVMRDVAERVSEGERLAEAMREHADVFPDVHVAMVAAGERGGFLESVLSRMASYLEHQADLRSNVIGSMIYPAVLAVVSLTVLIGAMVFFVPRFEPFFARMEVPWPTRVVLATSHLMTEYWLVSMLVLGIIVAGCYGLARQRAFQQWVASWELKVPQFGPLRRDLAVARVTRMLGTLLDNGVPLLGAMHIARRAAGQALLAQAIEEAEESVRAGESLAEPLGRCGLIPDDVIEMIAVGESANNLAEVLVTIAETIESRIDRKLTVAIRLLEPATLMVLGGMVMMLFMALVVPMLRMSQSL